MEKTSLEKFQCSIITASISLYTSIVIHKISMTSLVANLATNFQVLVAKEENLVALMPGIGAISCPALEADCYVGPI